MFPLFWAWGCLFWHAFHWSIHHGLQKGNRRVLYEINIPRLELLTHLHSIPNIVVQQLCNCKRARCPFKTRAVHPQKYFTCMLPMCKVRFDLLCLCLCVVKFLNGTETQPGSQYAAMSLPTCLCSSPMAFLIPCRTGWQAQHRTWMATWGSQLQGMRFLWNPSALKKQLRARRLAVMPRRCCLG